LTRASVSLFGTRMNWDCVLLPGLDNSGLCILSEDFDHSQPPSVTSASVNFPGEAFYWYAEAEFDQARGGLVQLTLAKEAAFTTEEANVGQQLVFERIRVRVDQLTAGTTYTITHPFGVLTRSRQSRRRGRG
jgi:hypothetical protein